MRGDRDAGHVALAVIALVGIALIIGGLRPGGGAGDGEAGDRSQTSTAKDARFRSIDSHHCLLRGASRREGQVSVKRQAAIN